MAEADFKYLYSPLKIGPMTLKNRLVFGPHVFGFLSIVERDQRYPHYLRDDRCFHYFVERAKGGVGLIIEAGHQVHPSASQTIGHDAFDEREKPFYRKMAQGVHQYGCKIIAQLHHSGAEITQTRQPMVAPSDVPDPCGGNEIPKIIEKEEIQDIIKGYVKVALFAKEGGYDGVELKAGHDSLIREFWSQATNRRQDEYGGSLDNRMRFSLEVAKAVRDAVGRDFVLGIRMCMDEMKPGGYNLEGALEIAKKLEKSGLFDYFNTDIATFGMGTHVTVPNMEFPNGCAVYVAAALKEAVDLPVIAAYRINDPVHAEKILADGQADLIAMVRQLICDPETPNKGKEGRLDDIRHCIADTQGCLGTLMTQVGHVRCVCNPAVSNEATMGIGTLKPATRKKKVTVVGGGLAGMKVAEIAARRGHQITLYEKDSELGGQIRIAAKGPHREDFDECSHWLKIQVEKLGVKVVYAEATPELIEKDRPDAVVIATGAIHFKPAYLPWANQANVMTAPEVLQDSSKVGKNVIVYYTWGTSAATSAADLLSGQGKKVEIVTIWPFVGWDLPYGWFQLLFIRLLGNGAVLTPFAAVIDFKDKKASVMNVFSQKVEVRENIDTVVISEPARADDKLYYALKGKGMELHRIGDCLAPRTIDSAIYEGEMLGRSL